MTFRLRENPHGQKIADRGSNTKSPYHLFDAFFDIIGRIVRTKQDILDEIKRTAKENNGKPLGAGRFENETGITSYEWGKYWARFGDALRAADFEPNQFQAAHPDDFLIQKIIGLARKLGKFPTSREIEVERVNDAQLPTKKAFLRFGTKERIALKVLDYCKTQTGYQDVIELSTAVLIKSSRHANGDPADTTVGEVYLFKSGRYYKIGKTNDTVRRGNEIRIQLPEKMELVHSIKTDDPIGVEAYWHKRFESMRKEGEWFDLTSREVKAFKRWKRIY